MSDLFPVSQWRVLTALGVTRAAISLLLAGCASFQNTPAQDLAWSRWTACRAQVTDTEVNRVQLDGRISFWYSGPGQRQSMLECLRQAAKDGPSLPEAVGDPRPGGGGGGM